MRYRFDSIRVLKDSAPSRTLLLRDRTSIWILLLATLWIFSGCASRTSLSTRGALVRADEPTVQALTADLYKLDRSVDLHEARAFADLALNHSLDLADSYGVVRPAVLHNVLVNLKFRERGLCFQWADDLQSKLEQNGMRTLRLYRVVARINTTHEHNAVVVAALGQRMREGIILDAWRHGGRLYWKPVTEDTRYPWVMRTDLPWMGDQRELRQSP